MPIMYKDYKQCTMYKTPCQGAIGQDEEIFTGLGQNTDPLLIPSPPLLTPF